MENKFGIPTSIGPPTYISTVGEGTLEAPHALNVNLEGHICDENTTTENLGSGETFTGNWQDTLNYGVITLGIKSDTDSATDGLKVQWSSDGVNVCEQDLFTILSNQGKVFSFGPARRYVRVLYVNGTSAQTSFNIETRLSKVYVKPSSHRINDPIVAEDDAELMKSVITGQKPDDTFDNVQITQGGNFKISLEELENDVSEDSNTTLRTTTIVEDEYGNVTRILGDNIFKGALITIPVEHHEIHCGDSYEFSHIADLGNGGVLDVLIIVPNEGVTGEPGLQQDVKQYHFKGRVVSEFEANVQFYEDTEVSDNGTGINVYNRNRNASDYTDFLGVYHTPTVTSAGTLLETNRIGSARSSGGQATRADEWILKDNTIYLLRITNNVTTDNYIDVHIDYYVHPGI